MTYVSTVNADSPAAFWECQDTSGSLTDSTGNGHTASVAGSGMSYSVQGPGPYDAVRLIGNSQSGWRAADNDVWSSRDFTRPGSNRTPGSAGDAYGPESTGGFYEPFLHRLNDDTILAAVRHDREKVWFAHSTDNGATWSTITKSSVARGGRPAICQVAETGGLVLSDRRDTSVRYTTSWDEGATWPNADVIILPSEFRGTYAQMAEYAPGVLGHAWSMEDDLGGATLRFTALYDSNLADPLA